MGFIFRFFRSQFIQHLLEDGLEVIESDTLDKLRSNQKRKRAPNKDDKEQDQ